MPAHVNGNRARGKKYVMEVSPFVDSSMHREFWMLDCRGLRRTIPLDLPPGFGGGAQLLRVTFT